MLRVTGQGVFARCYTLDLDQRRETKEERPRDIAVNWSTAPRGDRRSRGPREGAFLRRPGGRENPGRRAPENNRCNQRAGAAADAVAPKRCDRRPGGVPGQPMAVGRAKTGPRRRIARFGCRQTFWFLAGFGSGFGLGFRVVILEAERRIARAWVCLTFWFYF
jgi:hypothetical protein